MAAESAVPHHRLHLRRDRRRHRDALLPRLHGSASWKLTGYGNATNYGANKLRFVRPVPAGAKIQSRSRLIGVEAKPKGTQITQELNVHVVGDDTPALIYEMVVLYHPAMKRA